MEIGSRRWKGGRGRLVWVLVKVGIVDDETIIIEEEVASTLAWVHNISGN